MLSEQDVADWQIMASSDWISTKGDNGTRLRDMQLPQFCATSHSTSFPPSLGSAPNRERSDFVRNNDLWRMAILRDTRLSLPPDSPSCFSLQHYLMPLCCDGLPSLYQCQTTPRQNLLSSLGKDDSGVWYDSAIAPLDSVGTNIDVKVSMRIIQMSIANYGVDGGSIEVTGTAYLSWVDKRLRWDIAQVGCTEFYAQASSDPQKSEIWVPFSDAQAEESLSLFRATALADGSVSVNWNFQKEAHCEGHFDVGDFYTKLCKFSFDSNVGPLLKKNAVNYVITGDSDRTEGSSGVLVEDLFSITGYKLDRDLTKCPKL
mmetsp:Transcript_27467/g.40592  ORF Transcript_27467/g.40592 Transcript_27467/m.40592 type:complete len:316 (+) Transcript_27467:137-1084(+)